MHKNATNQKFYLSYILKYLSLLKVNAYYILPFIQNYKYYMGFKGPRILKFVFMSALYPSLYIAWVRLMQKSWINNDIKDLHPQIIFPQANRFNKNSGPYNYKQQYKEALIKEGKDSLRQKYVQKMEERKNQYKLPETKMELKTGFDTQSAMNKKLGQEYLEKTQKYFDYIYNTYTQ